MNMTDDQRRESMPRYPKGMITRGSDDHVQGEGKEYTGDEGGRGLLYSGISVRNRSGMAPGNGVSTKTEVEANPIFRRRGGVEQERLNSQSMGRNLSEISPALDAQAKNAKVSGRKVMTPSEIARLKLEDADTSPDLPDISVESGTGQSGFSGSVRKSPWLEQAFKDKAATEDEIHSYKKIADDETLDEAFGRLNENGSAGAFEWIARQSKEADAVDVAEGFILMKQYQDKAEKAREAGDTEAADNALASMLQVAKKLREIGTKSGQTVQMFSILGRMTPEGMLKYAQGELDTAYKKLVETEGRKTAEKYAEQMNLTPEETELILENMNRAAKLPDGRQKNILLAEISSLVSNKIPSTKLGMIGALQRNSMLLNAKTFLRNVFGNVTIMPNVIISDFVGSGIDRAVSSKTGVRTIGTTDVKGAAETIRGAGRGAYESFDDFRRGINTRNIDTSRFEFGAASVFKPELGKTPVSRAMLKALNRIDRTTSFLMDVGDRPFFEAYFTNSINNQMRLNHAEEPTAAMIEIATNEAMQRTWQDDNRLTRSVHQVRTILNGGKEFGLGSVLLPFTKTPANLTI